MTIDVFKILGICLVTAILAITVKSKSGEYALLIAIVAGIMVSLLVLKNLTAPILLLKQQLEEYKIDTEYFKVALKAVGIGYITSFIADACRDSGQTSLAAKAEFAGKCAIFLLSVPLIISILKTALGFIK